MGDQAQGKTNMAVEGKYYRKKENWILKCKIQQLRTFAPKSSHAQIFSKLSLQVENDKIRLKM